MPAVTQASLTGGEFSPRLYGRDDVGKYATAVSLMRNMLVFPQGGAGRRPPTVFVNPAKGGPVRLVDFVFGREDAYVLEFGERYVRVYRARGVVTLNNALFEFSSPYTAAQAQDIAWTQTADTLYIVHPTLNMRRLTRTSNTSWAFTTTNVSGARAVTFYQQRLVLGGSDAKPQQLRFSDVNNFENFSGSGDDQGFTFTLASDRVNTILWATPSRDTLLVGTQGGVWAVASPNQATGFSSANVEARRQSQIGCHTSKPAVVDQDVFFINRSKTQLRAATFDFGVDGYATPDQAVFAEHLAKRRLRDVSYQNDPDSVLFMPAEDGSLITATIQKAQEVNAWAQHQIAGRFQGEHAAVESVAVIPSPFGDIDDVWIAVARTVNGVDARHIERLADPYRPSSPIDRDGGAYLDSQLSIANTLAAVFTLTQSGGAWAAGETATLMTDQGQFAAAGERYMLRAFTRGRRLQRAIVTVETVETATCAIVHLVTDVPELLQGQAADETYGEIEAVTGLDHLEGETVGVVVDGAAHDDRVVADGGFALQAPAFEVTAGLRYVSEIVTLDYNLPTPAQDDGKTATKRISRVGVDFMDTLGAEVGIEGEELETVPSRAVDDAMDVAPRLFSGVERVLVGNSSAIERRVHIRQSTALPMTVRTITPEQTSSR